MKSDFICGNDTRTQVFAILGYMKTSAEDSVFILVAKNTKFVAWVRPHVFLIMPKSELKRKKNGFFMKKEQF